MTYTTGTSHFKSFEAARTYYAAYGFSGEDVLRKLAEGEIHIGKPALKAVADQDGRYHIEEK